MPLNPPRNDTSKKKDQLKECSENLRLAIFHSKSDEYQEKLVDKYISAKLSLIKAKLHVNRELEFKDKKPNLNLDKLQEEFDEWSSKQACEVIEEFKNLD